MGYRTKNVLSPEYINQPTAKISQQTGPYAVAKLSETLEETKISIRGRTGVEMLVGYPEGSHLMAPPLVLESRPQVLGTHALRTRSDSSSSAIAPRMLMGKALDAPGNARPSKRLWEQESNLVPQENQTKSE